MTTTKTISTKRGLFGWIHDGGCENAACKKAIREGRKFHAVPAGFAITLPDYHFATSEDAERALLACKTREEIGR